MYAYTRGFTSGRGKLLFLLPRKKLDLVDLVGADSVISGTALQLVRSNGPPREYNLPRWIVSASLDSWCL